jgi:DNA-binding Xre family transcriptional regulator
MISLNLTPLFQARGIERPFSFLVKAGFSRESATKLINGGTASIRFSQLEKLCLLFICEPNDLFLFTPQADKQYPPDCPLFKIIKQEPTGQWEQAFATLPFSQLKELTRNIVNDAEAIKKG